MKKIKELVIISGKGGTGKTTLTSSFAYLMKNKIIVDADADAADMFILMKPKVKAEHKFKGKAVAVIDQKKCSSCGVCKKLCRFDAINVIDGKYSVNPVKCDSCTLCQIACPENAIEMEDQISGEWFESETPYGTMVHARLTPGAENSGNLVTMVKHRAHILSEENGIDYILVDGSPGVGCPVISTISGANFVVIVTEPTQSGIHDLRRVKKLCDSFKINSGVVVNKYDLNKDITNSIKQFAEDEEMPFLGLVPFDRCAIEALVNEKLAVEYCDNLKQPIKDIFDKAVEKL